MTIMRIRFFGPKFMRDNWLLNRGFKSYEDILDHCCFCLEQAHRHALENHVLGTRDWAYRS